LEKVSEERFRTVLNGSELMLFAALFQRRTVQNGSALWVVYHNMRHPG
jgi:hypothetical protein